MGLLKTGDLDAIGKVLEKLRENKDNPVVEVVIDQFSKGNVSFSEYSLRTDIAIKSDSSGTLYITRMVPIVVELRETHFFL